MLRDGTERELAAAELTPVDLVLLTSGERVPADLRLLEVNGLQIDESMRTGEALPVTKQVNRLPVDTIPSDFINIAFSGTLAISGRDHDQWRPPRWCATAPVTSGPST